MFDSRLVANILECCVSHLNAFQGDTVKTKQTNKKKDSFLCDRVEMSFK